MCGGTVLRAPWGPRRSRPGIYPAPPSPYTVCVPYHRLHDELHRQIGNPVRSGLLLRENEQTALEGSRRASASHGTRSAPSTGTADRSVPVPVEGPVQKARTADECRHPRRAQVQERSTTPTRQSWWQGDTTLSLRSRYALDVRGKPASMETCTHDSLTHSPRGTDSMLGACHIQALQGSAALRQWISMAGHVVGRCS